MRKKYGVIVSLFLLPVGCATPTHPYVTVTPVGNYDPLNWLSDGPEMVCWAHNPPKHPATTGRLSCVAQDPAYAPSFSVSLQPNESKPVGFCQTMNKEVHADPCHIVEDQETLK